MSGMPLSPSLRYIGNAADYLRPSAPVETDTQRRLRLCAERTAALETYWLPRANTFSVERVSA